MKEVSEREKKDKRFSLIMSGIVHGALLLIFIVLVAWRPPDPPKEQYGMELNLGFDDAGSGDTESEVDNQAETDNTTPPEAQEEAEQVDPTPEEPVEEPVEETPPVTEPVEEVTPVEPVAEVVPDPVVEETVETADTQTTESDVKVEEKKKEEPVEEPKEEVKDPPKEEPKKEEPKKEEPKKVEPKKDPVVVKEALLGSKKSDTQSKDPASGNQGDKTNEKGNMGKPTGNKDSDGQSEDSGNLGVSLSLDGWAWDRAPSAKDDSEKDGEIRFRIKVNDKGYVTEVVKIQGTTIGDNTVVDFYRKEVMKLTFKRTATDQASAISIGEIRFIIKTK